MATFNIHIELLIYYILMWAYAPKAAYCRKRRPMPSAVTLGRAPARVRGLIVMLVFVRNSSV